MKTKLSPARNGHSTEAKSSPVADAIAAVRADEKAREAACMEAVNAVLKEHNCALHVVPNIVINGQPAGLLVKANSLG